MKYVNIGIGPKRGVECLNAPEYFIGNQNSVKKTWDGIRDILNVSKKKSSVPTKIIHQNEEKKNNMDIANSFNDFFVNIGKNIEVKISQAKSSFDSYLQNANEKSIFFKTF